ncbi:hypothetical protein PR048_001300 [Dryococelus australis]|uniref:Uncharacterized protein n=1 Tax=Dryococelus australis TaxID=614101 RepID=A0ABQ9IIC0_9NEOP|nr:hypothetical protein PR048_001300 [Dryococelus australis]
MYISDTLSCAYRTHHNQTDIFADLEREMELRVPNCSCCSTNYSVCRIIRVGWPQKLPWMPPELQQYHREDLSYADDLVLKGKVIVVSKGLRPEILTSVHTAHRGPVKCIQRAC